MICDSPDTLNPSTSDFQLGSEFICEGLSPVICLIRKKTIFNLSLILDPLFIFKKTRFFRASAIMPQTSFEKLKFRD